MFETILLIMMPPAVLLALVLMARWAWEAGASKLGTVDLDTLLHRKRLGLLAQGFQRIPDSSARNEPRSAPTQSTAVIVDILDDSPEPELEQLVWLKRRRERDWPDQSASWIKRLETN